MLKIIKQFSTKQFGVICFSEDTVHQINDTSLLSWIKILYLKKGSIVKIDFKEYDLQEDMIFFISPNQNFNLLKVCSQQNFLLYYNRDFYCIQIHDKEVACDGILYNNVYDIPAITLSENNTEIFYDILEEIIIEITHEESSAEEMLRILLKYIIIKSTRIWKSQRLQEAIESPNELDFLRKFSQLVEINFKNIHSVSDYADILGVSAKTLTKKISRYHDITPLEIIRQRIILEAKRLLVYTDLSIKEIAYSLGYEDPAYFNRFFSKSEDIPPAEFRTQYSIF